MIEAIKEWEKINEQQKEYIKVIKGDIESLKESYKIAHEYNKVADKEIERLNNIINELEKWVKEDTEKSMMTMETGRAFNMFDILDKIKELKGSDKE